MSRIPIVALAIATFAMPTHAAPADRHFAVETGGGARVHPRGVTSGGVGLWIGPGTEAYFRNLHVTTN